MQRRVYLDTSATTPVDPAVVEAMLPYFNQEFGNASSVHSYGQSAKAAIDNARRQVASLIGAAPKEIVFLSGGTEADNLAIRGVAEANKKYGQHIITSRIEHPAVSMACCELALQGYDITRLRVSENGIVDPGKLRMCLRDDTILVSIMMANNETGTIQQVAEIGKIISEIREKRNSIFFHTDAVQAVGRIPVNVDELGVDLLSLSGHKIYAPKGVGALYVRRGATVKSQLHGGRQERDRRAGTENVPTIVALGKAAELAEQNLSEWMPKMAGLRDRLEQGIIERIPDVVVNGDTKNRVPNLTNISFKYIEAESLLISLDLKGVAVSTGSACASGSIEPSTVLLAMGLARERAKGAIRFSLGKDTTREDIDYVLEILPAIVERLRKMSAHYRREQFVTESL